VVVTWNGKTVLSAHWGPAVAKNPFLSFKFKGGAKGDKISITWVDTRGDTRTDEAVIA
jgi:sulfur-oxidizing protein SoxZ